MRGPRIWQRLRSRLSNAAAATFALALLVPSIPGTLLGGSDEPIASASVDGPLKVYVVVVDGLRPGDISPTLTPTLSGLIEDGQARAYESARAVMVSETNSNHTAMMTGTYGDVSGLVANSFFNVRAGEEEPLDRPGQILVETLFDAIERQRPDLHAAAVLGKEKLVELFDCTRPSEGARCGPSTDNPEGIEVEHVRPDTLRGASTDFLELGEAPAEPASGSGVAMDNMIMNILLDVVRDEDPDFTLVNLAMVDAFQHLFGSTSVPGRVAVLNADLQIGRLVDELRSSGKWERSVLITLADHGFQDTGDPVILPLPELELGVHNQITPLVTGTAIVLEDLFGGACTGPESRSTFEAASHGGSASVYLTDFDPYEVDVLNETQRACLRELRSIALSHEGVDEALYRLDAGEGPDTLLENARPEWRLTSPRIGDILLTADHHHTFLPSLTSSSVVIAGHHGGPTAVPIPLVVASGGDFLASGTDGENPARVVDVAPTAAWLLGIDPPEASEGRVLSEAFVSHPADPDPLEETLPDDPASPRAAVAAAPPPAPDPTPTVDDPPTPQPVVPNARAPEAAPTPVAEAAEQVETGGRSMAVGAGAITTVILAGLLSALLARRRAA